MATKLVALSQAKVASTLVSVKEHAVKMAHLALAAHEQNMMRGLLEVADAAAADADQGDDSVTRLNDMLQGTDRVKASANEFLALETTIGDSLNNATTGLAFGLVGALDAGKVFTLSAAASSGLGVFGGTLGILFGSIGLLLGIKNAILGAMAKSRLETAKGNLSTDSELSEAVKYAIGQKKKKIGRNVAVGLGGAVAITAGVLTLIALSAATYGVAAIVVGIVAGLIGLGFVAYKLINRWQKRKGERTEFADQLIAEIRDQGDGETDARNLVSGLGLNPDDAGSKKFRKKLISKVGEFAKSKRTLVAEALVGKLVAGKPSEMFDAEVILRALNVDPKWIRDMVASDKPNAAVSKVAGKMASW